MSNFQQTAFSKLNKEIIGCENFHHKRIWMPDFAECDWQTSAVRRGSVYGTYGTHSQTVNTHTRTWQDYCLFNPLAGEKTHTCHVACTTHTHTENPTIHLKSYTFHIQPHTHCKHIPSAALHISVYKYTHSPYEIPARRSSLYPFIPEMWRPLPEDVDVSCDK